MKRILRGFITSLLITVLVTMNVFAMPFNPDDYTSVDIQSELLPASVKVNTAHESAIKRGDFFLNADLVIMNNGGGDIGALAKAYMSVPVEEIYITIYLDRWDADAERWRQVTYYDAEFYASDYPDGLSDPSVDIVFQKQNKGYYYRLRGVFGAVHNNKFEGFSPVTAGIWIE